MQPGNQKNRMPKKEQKKSMMDAVYKYIPYWPVFVILMAISMFGAWFYLRITPPLYEAAASIMIKDENKGIYNTEVQTELDPLSGKKIIENEVEVLKSKSLMNDVVKNLHVYASYFEEGEMAPASAYTTTPVLVEAFNPAGLRKIKKVEYSFSDKDSQVVINGRKYPLNQFVETGYGKLKFVTNKYFSAAAEKPLFFSLINPRVASLGFSSKLKIGSDNKSTVITLNFRDESPERAENILNELIAVYNKVSTEEKKKMASSAFKFLEDRIREVGGELQDIGEKSKSYQSSQDAVGIGQQSELYLKNVNEIDKQRGEIEGQLVVLKEVEKYLQSRDNTTIIMPSTIGLSDPNLSQLINTMTEKKLLYERLKKTSGENNPLTMSAKAEIDKLIPDISENVKNQRTSLEASKLNLNAAVNSFSSILAKIPKKEQDLIQISRNQTSKQSIYDFLQTKKAAVELSLSTPNDDSRIVDNAQALLYPVSPKTGMIYMVAIIFSLALPVGFISLKGMLNRKVLFRQEIENLTSFPIIGEIMLDNSKDPLVIQEGKRTFIAEQFRRIRTSLAYLGVSHAGKKRVLVTSSVSGEGKSFVALNLALSLAMTGKKVILLELDLANPSLSKKLDVHYEQGVSDYLQGQCEPEEVIKRTTANNNLFFLPCGSLPDNPSELIMNERLKELLNYLEDIFDHVVIDSAPSTLLTDAYVLSPMCHATLYVVKHKFTPKVYLERLEQENSVNQLSNVGIIFNGIRSRGFTKNGYGYGYGYGYIHDNSGKKVKDRKTKRA
ncbi:MAG TPA: polysaccharide biosynthesis tyrosine autokinase [Chitinophagaceae bacterium]|nr:polysaccharide biosynthesis tyrosine autokinase [Chitinophagaceae bacterium]